VYGLVGSTYSTTYSTKVVGDVNEECIEEDGRSEDYNRKQQERQFQDRQVSVRGGRDDLVIVGQDHFVGKPEEECAPHLDGCTNEVGVVEKLTRCRRQLRHSFAALNERRWRELMRANE